MKTIRTFENDERLVKIIFDEFNNTYTVSLITRNGKYKMTEYKKVYYAIRKFSEFACFPLKALGV